MFLGMARRETNVDARVPALFDYFIHDYTLEIDAIAKVRRTS